MTRRLPLELKLPLLMSVVLAIVLFMTLIAAYRSLRSYALERTEDRLLRATKQIANVGAATLNVQGMRYAAVANNPAVQRALQAGADGPDVRQALSRLRAANDSGLPIELWTADGRRIAFVGRDTRTEFRLLPGRPELPEQISRPLEFGGARGDTLRIGPLYAEGDSVRYWRLYPVRTGTRLIGYITHQGRVSTSVQAQSLLRELSGDSVTLFYANVDGSFSTPIGRHGVTPLPPVNQTHGAMETSAGERILFHQERIGNTPLVVGMTVSERTVYARPQQSIRNLFFIGLLALLLGTAAAWLIGRSVARPIASVAEAAEQLGAGNYAARVPDVSDGDMQRLATSFNNMVREIGASRQALEAQTRQAQAANSAKSEFLTTMSHELRTPLNAIGGYVELMEMGLRGPVTEEQRRDLDRIKTSQRHLLGLISSVLDLARIEAGRVSYDFQDIAVDPFLASLDALVAPQAAAKSVKLEYVPCPPDVTVVADPEKLRQVLLNLLSNAIRHTPADGVVTLSVEMGSNDVRIVVEDTGAGIPMEKRESIFEPFVQLDRSLRQSREGMGLGLAISRDLARGMAGELVAEASESGGARFVLTLQRGALKPMRSPEGVVAEAAHRG